MKKTKISVIIPTYNRYKLLLEAINSVKKQTYKDYELMVVDDGSTDETPKLLHDENLKYIRVKHTGNPGLVRNLGVEQSKGDYIAFLDSDDLWKKDKLEKQITFFKNNPEIKLCHTREIWKRDKKIISQKKQDHKRSGNIFKDALKKCIVGPSTVMMERSIFVLEGGFREDMEIAEDYEFWIRITSKFKIGYIDEPLVVKRAGKWEQLSEKYGQIEIFRIEGLKKLVEHNYFVEEKMELALNELIRKCKIYSRGCKKRNKDKEAKKWEKYISLLIERYKGQRANKLK